MSQKSIATDTWPEIQKVKSCLTFFSTMLTILHSQYLKTHFRHFKFHNSFYNDNNDTNKDSIFAEMILQKVTIFQMFGRQITKHFRKKATRNNMIIIRHLKSYNYKQKQFLVPGLHWKLVTTVYFDMKTWYTQSWIVKVKCGRV